VAVCEAMVVQVLPLRRCKETVRLVNGAPLAVSWPVIEKDWLTWVEEGAEIVRVVEIFAAVAVIVEGRASTEGVALQNSKAQTTIITATTITPRFSANIPPHLER